MQCKRETKPINGVNIILNSYVYWTVHHCDSWRIKDQLDVTILFHFLCAQHVSDINISIIRSLRLFCWITTLVVLLLVRCVLEFRCGWVGVVSVLQAEACNTDTTPAQPHRNSSTHWTKNNTTNVVIAQNSRKFLMMDILMSETFWAHKKWNKIASDIKLVFYSSTYQLVYIFYLVFPTSWLVLIWLQYSLSKYKCSCKHINNRHFCSRGTWNSFRDKKNTRKFIHVL